VISIIMAGGIVTAHSWQISKTAKSMLTLALVHEEQSEWFKAADYLDRYLRIEPGDLQARVRLASDYGRAAVTPPQKLRAIDLYYKVLSVGRFPEERQLRERLAELLLETGRLPDAERQAGILVKNDADSPLANRLLALALYHQYENGALAKSDLKTLGVLKTVENANRLNPGDVSVTVALASIYRNHPRLVRTDREITAEERGRLADKCFERLVQASPKSARAYLARFLYRTQYQLDGAQDDLNEALRLAPDDGVVLRTVAYASLVEAQRYTTAGQAAEALPHFRRAQELLARLVSQQPDQATAADHLGLGDAYLGMGQKDLALKSWNHGILTFSQPTIVMQFHARIADTCLEHGDLAQTGASLKSMEQIISDIGSSVPRREVLVLQWHQSLRKASLHLRKNNPDKAIEELERIIGQNSAVDVDAKVSANAWMIVGAAYSSTDGQWIEAAQAFDRAAVFQPQTAAPYIAAANAWLQAGRLELAADRAQSAIKSVRSEGSKSHFEARVALSTSLFRMEMKRSIATRDWGKFKKSLAELEKLQPPVEQVKTPWQVDFLRAEYEFNQPKSKNDVQQPRERAAGILKIAEKKYAESAEFLSQLCLLFEQFDFPQEADRVLAQLREIKGQPLIVALASARLASSRKQFDAANREFDHVEEHLSAAELTVLLDERIRIALANRNFAQARPLLLRQLGKSPRNLSVIKRLADIDLERRDMTSLEKWEESLSQLGAFGQPLFLYYHACRLIFTPGDSRATGLQEALDSQDKLAKLRPEWSETHALRGMLEQDLGHLDQAVIAFERAANLGDPRLYVFERLITLLEVLKRGDDAEKYLSRLQLQMPRSQQLTELASQKHLQQLHPDYAVATARLAVENRPDDASAHAWLGRMLLLSNNTEESEREFAKTVELAPHDVSSWRGLISFYVRNGAKEKAQAILKDLAEKAPLGEADRSFVLGQGYELLGDVAAAIRHYEEAAAKSPASSPIQLHLAGLLLRSDPHKAEICLRKVIELNRQDSAGRHMLARLLAARGTDAAFQEAESLLKNVKEEDLSRFEDQRLRAILLSQRGGQENIARAIELIVQLLEGQNSVAGDRLFLAQLYESQAHSTIDPTTRQAKLKLAKEQLLAAASKKDVDPRYISAVIEFLARSNETAELSKWLKRYEEKLAAAPQDQADPIAKFILLQVRLKKTDNSAAWLQKLEKVDRHPVRPLALRAMVLIAKGQQQEALHLIELEGAKRTVAAVDDRQKLLIYQGLGDLLFGLNEFSGAEMWYRHLLKADPTRFEFLVAALAQQRKHSEVLRVCEDAAKTDKSSKPVIVLANAIFETSWTAEQTKPADPFISTALERFPEDRGLLYTAGLVRIVQDRSDDAIVLFRKLVSLEPNNVAALNNLALLLAERPDDRKEALQLIDRAIEISGGEPSLLDTKGTILIHDGQAATSISILESAANSPNPDPRYRLHLALAYRESGNLAKAKQELTLSMNQRIEGIRLTANDRRLLHDLKTTLASQ
jgi:tetratricopeptide (TPR) repeat protein